jgi:hypothetical protein
MAPKAAVLYNVQAPSRNTVIGLRYKAQPVNAVWGNTLFTLRTIRNPHIYLYLYIYIYIYNMNSVRASQEIHVSATKSNRLMLFGETRHLL